MINNLELLKKECYALKIKNEFPKKLALLEEFRRIKFYNKKYLKNVTVLFIQHHLYPFIGRLAAMKEDGMVKENTWFIDIPYSTHQAVLKKVRKDYTNHDFPEPYTNSLKNYTNFQLNRTQSTIMKIIKTNPKKLLVVDDGAYFIRSLYDIYVKKPELIDSLKSKTYIIEQTTRGHRYLLEDRYQILINMLNTPIVSIARSKTKLEIEAPFIGIACKKAIEKNKQIISLIKRRNQSKKNPLIVGIIGYGSIGASVFDALKKMIKSSYHIDIIETDFNKWAEIKSKNGNPIPEIAKKKYDMLLGCTGYKSFGWNDRNKININGLLVSVSSAAIEFSRSNYIEFAELYPDDPIEINHAKPFRGIHTDLLFEDGKNKFYFVNSGFPVNFTGKKECLPLKFIQPTHALLYAASYQVLNNPIFGLNSLCDEYDNWIYYNSFNYS